jgi:hypothetical protein
MRIPAACAPTIAEKRGTPGAKVADADIFQARLPQKMTTGIRTYAQNLWYSYSRLNSSPASRYQTNSECKSLIYKETSNCLFPVQFKESLDLQGLAASCNKLSTKLSTENLDKSKTVKNQALSALSGCSSQALRWFGRPK